MHSIMIEYYQNQKRIKKENFIPNKWIQPHYYIVFNFIKWKYYYKSSVL